MRWMVKLQPFVSRGDFLGRLNADFGIPFPRWKHNHLVQKLIYACDKVLSISGLVGDIAEELGEGERVNSARIVVILISMYCSASDKKDSALSDDFWRLVKHKLWKIYQHFDLSWITFKNNCQSVTNHALETLRVKCTGA